MAKYEIWDRRDKSTPLTPEIIFDLPMREIRDVAVTWDAYKKAHRPSTPPVHDDWDWKKKASTAGRHSFVGLAYADEIEGMMMISLEPQRCLLPQATQKSLLYIEYLETAPWNQKPYAGTQTKLIAVGTCLIDVAIDISWDHGCEGRLGLHSLEEAKGFYQNQGFENLGKDTLENLNYFELHDRAL